jgi:acyl carrier protein
MSADPTRLSAEALGPDLQTVRGLVAEVLMLEPSEIGDESRLVLDLGAESIDFLDLVFRVEDAVGRRVPVETWEEFVREAAEASEIDPRELITIRFVAEFLYRQRQGED